MANRPRCPSGQPATGQVGYLLERRAFDPHSLHRNLVQRSVVEDDHGVGVLREPLHREDRVVRLDNHIVGALLVREHRVRL